MLRAAPLGGGLPSTRRLGRNRCQQVFGNPLAFENVSCEIQLVTKLGPIPHTPTHGGHFLPAQSLSQNSYHYHRWLWVSRSQAHRNCGNIAKDLHQSRCPCRADEYHTHPRGKSGCVIRFHFRKTDSKCPAKVGGIQVGASEHTAPQYSTVTRNKILVLTQQCPLYPPPGAEKGGGTI